MTYIPRPSSLGAKKRFLKGANLPSLRVSLAPLGHINPHKWLTKKNPPGSESVEKSHLKDKEQSARQLQKVPPQKNYTPEN